jgi:YD repeat-containing protein
VKRLVLALVAIAACNPTPARKLPGATMVPKLGHTERAAEACGFDVAFNGSPTVTVRYTNMYDELGRVIRVAGRYEDFGPDDFIDYTYDHLDHLTHSLETRGAGYDRAEETEDYDTLGDLVAYTLEQSGPGYDQTTKYLYRDLSPSGQPATEIISFTGSPDANYQLAYDETDRIIAAVVEGGSTTTYTYDDDDTRSVTIDTDHGAFVGVVTYDDQSRELSEVWGGSDPQAQHQQTTYVWSGDRLGSITFLQGTPLATVEVETPRYRCDP